MSFEERFELFPVEGRISRAVSDGFLRPHLRQDRQGLDALVVVGDPIHYLFAVMAELFRSHMELLRFVDMLFLRV